MPETLPARASLAWLRKSAKQQLRGWRAEGRSAKLADAQFDIARRYGFPSWRALKAHVDRSQHSLGTAEASVESDASIFLRHVGHGDIDDARAMLAADPEIVNAV